MSADTSFTGAVLKGVILYTILIASVLYLALQGKAVLNAVQEKRPLEISPVIYGELVPDKEEYTAGELIGFSFDRTCVVDKSKLPLSMTTIDSFENLDTGETFPGATLGRIVRRNGTEHLRALRRLHPDCTPGTYSFEGSVEIKGELPTRPVLYFSRKFKVKQPNK